MVKTEEEDDIYKQFYIDNNVINPYEIVEKEELELITNLWNV